MGAGLVGDGLMGGELVSDGLASRNQRYRVLGLMWWDWAMAASCAFPVGCSLGASSRKIEGANQTIHEAPNEHP